VTPRASARTPAAAVRVDIWHTILWSRYKAAVFSHLYDVARTSSVRYRFIHVAVTESSRKALGEPDLGAHRYPYDLMFDGSWDEAPRGLITWRSCLDILRTKARVVAIAGYSQPIYWAQLLIAKLWGRVVIGFCDSTALDRKKVGVKELMKRLVLPRFELFFCYGRRSCEYLQGYGIPETALIDGCQAADPVLDLAADALVAARLRAAEDPPGETDARAIQLLYVGRLAPEKDIPTLLRAIALLVNRARPVRARIVGGGPLLAALQALADELGVAAHVDFCGSRSGEALAQEYLRADMLVLPSRSEPWGLVANEALQLGCPIVVSDVCGCVPELCADPRISRVFSVGDADHLAASIEALHGQTPCRDAVVPCCLETMAAYTPRAAALRMHQGLLAFLGRRFPAGLGPQTSA
jgi:glycosyltransferase involved in cell wall biosynthesis